MASETFGKPITKIFGEQVSLTTTAVHLNFQPGYNGVMLHCPTAWRMGIAPRLAGVIKNLSTTYTSYITEALDKLDATDVVLDGMTTGTTLYLGVVDKVRGFYFKMDGSGLNANPANLEFQYCYDIAGSFATNKAPYTTLTGTVSAALVVGEPLTGVISGAIATVVYDNGSTEVVIKDLSKAFVLGETANGSSQDISSISAIDVTAKGTGYFTDVSGANDGTFSGTETLSQSGLYYFTLPSVVYGVIPTLDTQPLHWYSFKPSATLSATTRINRIRPATDTTDYGFMQAGVTYEFSLDTKRNGAFEFDHTGSDTLDVNWVLH